MQANYSQPGCLINHTPGGALTGGDVVVQQDLVGATPRDIAASALGTLQIDGVHSLVKTASGYAFAVDDPVYWDDTNNVATQVANGNAFVGFCTEAATAAQTYVMTKMVQNAAYSRALLYSAIAASTAISNTVTETAFDKAVSIAASTLKPGDVIRVRAQGIVTAQNATDTLDVALRLGTQDIIVTGAVDVGTNDIFFIDCDIVVRTNGASGTMVAAGTVALGAEGTVTAKPKKLASTALDTTAAQSVNCSATWSVANAGNSVRLDVLDVQVIRK